MRKTGGSSRSRALLLAAVTEVLDSGTDADRVTITDIVTSAGLTRPTFYVVFDDLPSAFAAAALARLEGAFNGLGVDPAIATDSRSEQMLSAFTAILSRLSEHAEFFARVLRGPGGPIVQERIVEFVAARVRESSPVSQALAGGRLPVEVSATAIAAGVVWTMMRWIDEQPRRPVADVAVQLRDLVETSVFGGLGGMTGAPGAEAGVRDLSGVVS